MFNGQKAKNFCTFSGHQMKMGKLLEARGYGMELPTLGDFWDLLTKLMHVWIYFSGNFA